MMMQELMYDVMTGAEEAGRGGWDVRNVCVYPVAGSPYYSLKQRQFRQFAEVEGHSQRTSSYS